MYKKVAVCFIVQKCPSLCRHTSCFDLIATVPLLYLWYTFINAIDDWPGTEQTIQILSVEINQNRLIDLDIEGHNVSILL